MRISTSVCLLLTIAIVTPAAADPPDPKLDAAVHAILRTKCLSCHDATTQESDLSLENQASMLEGGKASGPAVIPGDSAKSPLILYLRGEKQPQMPEGEDPLPEEEIKLIARWIDEMPRPNTPKAAGFWPWTPLQRPTLPEVKNTASVANPIDAFVLAQLQQRGIEPAPLVGKRELFRRLHYSATGLPPTPASSEEFVHSDSPTAYAEAIERVLDDPAYGEHWGRLWLDLARYSDTRGGAIDYSRPHMWRYRDYVIRAFNQDRPYDRFIREQLAGDAYPTYGTEAKLGLGFLAQWVQVERDSGELARRDYLNDVVSTTSAVFLGMTFECAECHDHKYDPIRQRDYFRFEAFFASTVSKVESLPFSQYEAPKLNPERWDAHKKSWAETLEKRAKWHKDVKEEFKQRIAKRRQLQSPADLKDLIVPVTVGEVRDAVDAGRLFTKEEQALYKLIGRQSARFANPNSPDYYLEKAHSAGTSQLANQVATHILAGGNYKLKGERVEPGFPSAITGNYDAVKLRQLGGKPRKILADWIANPDNPLTARVLVNRLWQHHFGTGLVVTPSDFGKNGSGTVHQDLLDWLATEFIDSGWSIKHIHRLILSSNVFRQSTRHPRYREYQNVDPANKYLWVRAPVRLQGEAIRDSLLAASGELNREMGRPPYFPVADDGLLKSAPTWWEPSELEERSRRTVYMLQSRSFPLPMMKVFDGRNMDESCPDRGMTTVTPQVFTLFNSPFSHARSHALATRIIREVGHDPARQVDLAFRLVFQRTPPAADRKRCISFLRSAEELAQATASATVDKPIDPPAGGTLADLCLVLFNMNEFIYLD